MSPVMSGEIQTPPRATLVSAGGASRPAAAEIVDEADVRDSADEVTAVPAVARREGKGWSTAWLTGPGVGTGRDRHLVRLITLVEAVDRGDPGTTAGGGHGGDMLEVGEDVAAALAEHLREILVAGDNVVEKSERMPWYRGGPLLYLLETMSVSGRTNAIVKIATSLTNDVIMPPISILLGSGRFEGLTWVLRPATDDKTAIVLNLGTFITTVMDFMIVAFVIFMLVKQINRLKAKPAAPTQAPPAPTTKDRSTPTTTTAWPRRCRARRRCRTASASTPGIPSGVPRRRCTAAACAGLLDSS